MDRDPVIQNFVNRVSTLKQSRNELNEELLSLGTQSDKLIHEMNTVNTDLEELKSRKPDMPLKSAEQEPQPPEANFEKVLQGSLDALGDKLSDKLLNMMNELKSMVGPKRTGMMKKIKAAADFELVDLSNLFAHDEIKSNIQEIGIDEKEAKGIDKSLEKLQQMKRDKEK